MPTTNIILWAASDEREYPDMRPMFHVPSVTFPDGKLTVQPVPHQGDTYVVSFGAACDPDGYGWADDAGGPFTREQVAGMIGSAVEQRAWNVSGLCYNTMEVA